MSPALRVRERGTWKVWATLLALIFTVGAAGFGGAMSVSQAAEPQAPAGDGTEKATKKKKVKKVNPDTEPKASPDEDPSVEDMIRSEWGGRAEEALGVAHCESRFDPVAVSRKGAIGVFQIMPRFHGWRVSEVGGSDLKDAATNIRVARALFEDEGWRPWVCARILGLRA